MDKKRILPPEIEKYHKSIVESYNSLPKATLEEMLAQEAALRRSRPPEEQIERTHEEWQDYYGIVRVSEPRTIAEVRAACLKKEAEAKKKAKATAKPASRKKTS